MKNSIRTQRYPVGTKFTTRGKAVKACFVSDFLTITNSKGDVIGCQYVAIHQFLGQTVTDWNVPESAIARGEPVIPSSCFAPTY